MTFTGNNNWVGKFGLIVLLVLASPEGPGIVEGLGIGSGGRGTGRIQIQEQDLNPSPFKTFLEEQATKDGSTGGTSDNNRLSPEWETVIDPKLYIITEYDENSLANPNPKTNEQFSESDASEDPAFARLRRNNQNSGHSLSIVNPLDVLRQRLLLEIARRRNLKQNQHQIIANAEILKNIG